MKVWQVCAALVLILLTAFAPSNLAMAARCQVSNVAYSIPQEAAPAQSIQTRTTVTGSCYSDGEDYYSVRVDLIDVPSSAIWSSNSTPIGYNATNFTVTVENIVTTPSTNGSWHINLNVYVIRAGGTSGSYLLDYRTVGNATILVGAATPIPEFPGAILSMLTAFLILTLFVLTRRRGPRRKELRKVRT